jgi:hypothetical protein
LIKTRFEHVNLDLLEKAPDSVARKKVVEEDLRKAKAGEDREVLEAAQALLQLVMKSAPNLAGTIGVNLQDIEAASLRISNVVASGTGVNVSRAKTTGPIDITGVQAGRTQETASKKKSQKG